MNNNELNRIADLIWGKLHCFENENKSKHEQIELIKPVLLELYSDSLKTGHRQILNYMRDEISNLSKDS